MSNVRQERIEQLLQQLKYEVTRGMMEREIDETIGFEFIVPISSTFGKGGVVHSVFQTRPTLGHSVGPEGMNSRLRIVGSTI